MKKLNKKGFTLLELLAVLVILAALATIAIPIFTNKGAEARLNAHKSNIRELLGAIQRYEWDKGTIATTTANYYGEVDKDHLLVQDGYIASTPASPYATDTTYSTYRYVVGIDAKTSKTTVKLVVPAGALDTDKEFNAVLELVPNAENKDITTSTIVIS